MTLLPKPHSALSVTNAQEHLSAADTITPLKRSHRSAISSPAAEPHSSKQAKRSASSGPATSPKDAQVTAKERGRRPQQAAGEETDPADQVMQSPDTGQPVSFLGAAAAALSQGEQLPAAAMSVPSRGGAAVVTESNTLPMRSSPQASRAGSQHASQKSAGSHLLHSIALVEYLQLDERPTLVVDIANEDNLTSAGLSPVFVNNALKSRAALFEHVHGRAEDPSLLLDLGTPFSDFKSWALNSLTAPDIVSTFPYAGWLWQSSLIRKRLKILVGRQHHASPATLGDHTHRPGFQQFHGLGSAPTSTSGRSEMTSAPGYFDIPPRSGSDISRRLQTLVTTPAPEASPDSIGPTSPVRGGDGASSDLLSGSGSVSTEQGTLSHPARYDTGSAMVVDGEKRHFDWTRLPISPSLPEHVQFARGIDWGNTALGPIDGWSVELRGMCNLIMASPHPSAMYWGRDHIAIYNEAYILLAGQKHPSLMGTRYCDAWSEIWDVLKEVFDNAFENAQATMRDDDCLFLTRNGFLEETYFSWSIIPLIGADGNVCGLYNPAFEKTRRKIAERRMLTLREIGEKTAAARQVSQFWGLLLQGLEYNEYDAPMVMIYSLNDDLTENDAASSGSSGAASNKVAYLEGSLGIPEGHLAAPPVIDMKTGTKGFANSFRQALTTDRPIVLRVDDGTLDTDMLEDIEWRGFGDPSKIVVIAPIHPTTGESTLGFLVMATNPRRPYDEDYDLFVQLLGRQLATSVASVVLFEEEIRKGEKAAQLAAQDRIELNNQLVVRTRQAVEAENKFTRMAELAPVGIVIGNVDGKINFVNDSWYRISSYPRDTPVENDWVDYVLDEDQQKLREVWKTMLEKRCPISLEFRFKTPWRDRLGNKAHTWVLTSASPERDEDGQIKRIFGSMTDISAQKFAENLQTRRMEEAVEMKRQQERYIDTTSHELRNPLSAILQCADSITAYLTEMRDANDLSKSQLHILELTIDSAQTITLCAQHQKRIVDDVLTLSKLDSAMMTVTPVDTRPMTVVHKVFKMFDAEFKTNDIKLEMHVDQSFHILQMNWLRLDPHRLSQVLINLMTNAIKFTTTQENRVISVHVAASEEKPAQEDKWGLRYIPSRTSKDKDVTAAAEWGLGKTVYIHFAVQDTGRGLDDLEKKQLFQRFSQASPRTHVTYGGSGLGLFISRELVELQGGEVGVASESGKGSIFAFYVKARRSQAIPSNHEESPISSTPPSRKASRTTPLTGLAPSALQSNRLDFGHAVHEKPTSTLFMNNDNSTETLHVLIVEDNLINQKVLAAQLRKIGCIVHVANHGGEAIDQIKNSRFYHTHSDSGTRIDIVLMDLEMPVMDGQTCARKLREMQSSGELVAHIPLIAVTANARAEQIEMTLQSGIDDVVSKPFRLPELVPKMRDVIAKIKGGDGDG